MNILFKYASRGRPGRFFDGMDSIVNNLGIKDKYHISCTLDSDDTVMNNEEVIRKIFSYSNVSISWGVSLSKIDAFNRDMPDYPWDICIAMSDDLRFIVYGFDELVREWYRCNAPDTDGLCHALDNDAKLAVPVLYISGKKYYERDGYIYHPSYKSLFSDNDSMCMAMHRGKYFFTGVQIINHLNPAYGHLPRDEMFNRQQDDWAADELNFIERRKRKFDLRPEEIVNETI